jgi:hypothetical protein
MSTTYEVPLHAKVDVTVERENMRVLPFDATIWEVLDTKVLDEYDSNETVLKSIGGDVNYPSICRIGIYNKPMSDKFPHGASNTSIKTTYWVIVKDTDDEIIDAFQRTVVSASTGPLNRTLGDNTVDVIGEQYSLVSHRDATPAQHVAGLTVPPTAARMQAGISNCPLSEIVALVAV